MSKLVDGDYLDEWKIHLIFSIGNVTTTQEMGVQTALETDLHVKQFNDMFFVSNRFGPQRGQGKTVEEAVLEFLKQRFAKERKS